MVNVIHRSARTRPTVLCASVAGTAAGSRRPIHLILPMRVFCNADLKIILLLFGLLISSIAFSCESCGSYFWINALENQNSISMLHRYRVHNGYNSVGQDGKVFPTGAYRLSQPVSVLHSTHGAVDPMSAEDYESFKVFDLRARFFLSKRMHLSASLPFVNNKTKAFGSEANVWSPGDATLSLNYRLLQIDSTRTISHHLELGLGVRIPTGSCKATYDDGDRLPFMLQPGAGSWGTIASATYALTYEDWIFGISSVNRYGLVNEFHEQAGLATNNSLVILKHYARGKWNIYPQLQVYQEYVKGIFQYGYLISGTEMNNILIGPGMDIRFGKFGFSSCFQLPAYQEVYEMNMEMTCRLVVGVSYNFGGYRYLFN